MQRSLAVADGTAEDSNGRDGVGLERSEDAGTPVSDVSRKLLGVICE